MIYRLGSRKVLTFTFQYDAEMPWFFRINTILWLLRKIFIEVHTRVWPPDGALGHQSHWAKGVHSTGILSKMYVFPCTSLSVSECLSPCLSLIICIFVGEMAENMHECGRSKSMTHRLISNLVSPDFFIGISEVMTDTVGQDILVDTRLWFMYRYCNSYIKGYFVW